MEIRRYVLIVRRRWPLVILIVVAALASGFLITNRTNTYTATSTLYVGSRSIDIAPQSGQVSGDRVAGLDRLIATFTELARTRPIAAAAGRRAGVPLLPGEILVGTAAAQVPTTNLIRISFTGRDPGSTQAVANAIATSLVDQVRNFEPRDSEVQTDQVLSVYDQAGFPAVPNPSELPRKLALSGLFGLIAAAALLALLEYLDVTLRSTDDAERQLGLPVLGVVPSLGDELPITPVVAVHDGARPSRAGPLWSAKRATTREGASPG